MKAFAVFVSAMAMVVASHAAPMAAEDADKLCTSLSIIGENTLTLRRVGVEKHVFLAVADQHEGLFTRQVFLSVVDKAYTVKDNVSVATFKKAVYATCLNNAMK